MRIALISRRFDAAGGGTERDLLITAQLLAGAGHQVTIYAAEVRRQYPGINVRSIVIPPFSRALGLLFFGLTAAAFARKEGTDLVVSFARAINADIVRSGGGAHQSYMVAARQWQSAARSTLMKLSPYHRVQVALERAAFGSTRTHRVIAVSDLVRSDLIKSFALPGPSVSRLYNGVDLKRFVPNPDKSWANRLRTGLGIEDSPAIAFVGNGFARKGLRFLIEAWPRVDSRARLVVAGVDQSVKAYQRRAIQLGVGDRVIFLGKCRDVARLFAAVDALALPSLFEPFGNVVMEAMAAGLPALCSRKTGAAELIPQALSETVVTDPTDVEELAQRLKLLLELPPEAGQLLRSTAEQYTWERYGSELQRILSL
jgi:UDP-glucose:(heptosyl)LPS alpha-1,3-glucosyltransferase